MMKISEMPKYEVYKDSGVEWIGAIPVHWNSFPLCAKSKLKSISNNENEELLSVYLDKGVIKFDDVDAKRTNTTSSDLTKYQLVDPGDFVLNNQQAWRGSVGVSDYRGIVSPAYLVLSLSEDIVPRFGNYLFRDGAMVANYLVSSKGVGTIQRNLYWPQLKRALVFLPPTEEQLLIANFLDKKTALIDEAISIKEQQISLLKERKQIIIQQAVTQGLDPNVPMKDSGMDWIGKIPQHWKLKPNKCLFKLKKSLVGKRSGDYELLSLTLKGIIKRDMDNPEGKFPAEFNTYQEVSVGDFVFCLFDVEETPRTVGLSKFNGMITGAYTVFELDESVSKEFLYYFYLNLDSRKMMRPLYKGLRNTISKETFLSFKSFIPPLKEQEEIVDFIEYEVNKIDLTIDGISEQIDKIKEYKSCLINGSVTGKIKVTSEMAER